MKALTPPSGSSRAPANVRCHRPWTGFEVFDRFGDVRPCSWGKLSCGNLNQQSAAEIWAGSGYRQYRRAMQEGTYDLICNRDCPILQGHYSEPRAAPDLPARGPGGGEAAPEYLRVMTATRDNPVSSVGDQCGDASPALPSDLFEQLSPWMRHAREMLVLGSDTFRARECLSWIERASPEAFPLLRLAAVTSGLALSSAVVELVSRRRWSWVLVSIDAATHDTYRRVHGGSFAELSRSLDRLAAVRRTTEPFELRFGFTLQLGNLSDAEQFVSFCSKYDAMPQFTVADRDRQGETPRSRRDYERFMATLELIDKRLWSEGFGSRMLAGAMERMQHFRRSRTQSPQGHREIHIDASDEGMTQWRLGAGHGHARTERRLIVGHGDFGKHPGVEAALLGAAAPVELAGSLAVHPGVAALPRHYVVDSGPDADAAAIERACRRAASQMAAHPGGDRLLTLVGTDQLARHAATVADWARDQAVRGYRIALPTEDGTIASAGPVVRTIRRTFAARRIPFLGGVTNLVAAGLHPGDQFAEPLLAFERRRDRRVGLTILSPAYGLAEVIEMFIASVGSQRLEVPCELVVVDDGSADATLERAVSAASRLPDSMDVVVLHLPRKRPYRTATFSFRAGLARQAGLLRARGDRVLFVDADQRLAPDCAQAHVSLGRFFDVVLGDRDYETAASAETLCLELRHRAVTGRRDWWLAFYTGNASVRTEVLVAAGGFDETLQFWGLDDTDLGYRLVRAGANVWHTMRARVEHLAGVPSGGGTTRDERRRAWGVHRDVLYRKYLDDRILRAFAFLESAP